ncbi:hypothetical protein GGTG_07639 [Gaeumannomyces tritici R3-111a-1]|uniref:Methyltransferase domain-containing protein n=1 Tax=Gaeumannomyces tritici (strain R3-111a-1) TaxID=644352 RepID=J3P291_GAET3|nr:hypothetical protein GGTG_07639 [Gaeumannomyces tritici R3-111a-1]EJT73783.1 hypothetical protein GGTG_07639 [Gaeumannomyces tritici R3-111a-1]
MATSEYRDPENLKQRIKDSYDAIAPTYNTWTQDHSPVRLEFVDKLLKLLDVSSSTADAISILELGAGAGIPATARLLASSPRVRVTANDISSAQVSLGRANLAAEAARVAWEEGDMCALSFGPGSLDAVLALFSIIHLPRAEQAEMLGKLHDWLRPGGYLVANFVAEPMEGFVLEKWLHDKGWMYWSGFGAEGTLDKIREAGFEIVESEVRKEDVDAAFLWVVARKLTEA